MKKRVVIGGSTGTIGTKALSVIGENPGEFKVTGLIAHSNSSLFRLQLEKFKPQYYIFGDLMEVSGISSKQLDAEACQEIFEDCDLFLNGISGVAGLKYTLQALKGRSNIALANKESIILGKHLMEEVDPAFLSRIIPVDSEHSSLYQLLRDTKKEDVKSIVLTASGGILKNRQVSSPSPKEILDHPNWSMGSVITVDSSTMVNKAYEVIEAHLLFGFPLDNIEVLLHPQSAVHGMIRFKDGNSVMHYSPTDMYFPIRYALYHPRRITLEREEELPSELTFEGVNYELYPNFHLFVSVLSRFDRSGAALIYSNQKAVECFLEKRISFEDIFRVNSHTAEHFRGQGTLSPEELPSIRNTVDNMIEGFIGGKI